VANVLSTVPLNVSFRHGLINANRDAWFDLVLKVVHIRHSEDGDFSRKNLTTSGLFSVRSMYLSLVQDDLLPVKSPIWNLKSPLKIKIFLWYLKKGVLPNIILQSRTGMSTLVVTYVWMPVFGVSMENSV
jgi:hypothetical protein